ncbi:MAG: hypothetical protein ABSB65_16120 [Candidatus Acidiferrales bacterium]|jgi:hypothetical protein
MIKIFRFLAICTVSLAFSSIAGAQTYQQVDFPGACPGTTFLAGGPNLEGTGVGGYVDSGCVVTHGFSYTAKGVYTSFDPPGSTNTEPAFINLQGVIVGGYLDSNSVNHGFILDHGKYTFVDVKGAAGSELSSINDLGELSGSTCSDPACGFTGNANTTHSFLRSPNGVFKFFDPPGATSSSTSTVSLLGAVVGNYTDTVGELNHAYFLFLGKYTTIDFPGATGGTFATGGNVQNEIVGTYFDAAGIAHGWLLRDGKFTEFDYPVPGVLFTEPTGINALGVMVGFYEDASDLFHGFVRTP